MSDSWFNWTMLVGIVFAFGLLILDFADHRAETTAASDRCRQLGGVLMADANRKLVCVKVEVLK